MSVTGFFMIFCVFELKNFNLYDFLMNFSFLKRKMIFWTIISWFFSFFELKNHSQNLLFWIKNDILNNLFIFSWSFTILSSKLKVWKFFNIFFYFELKNDTLNEFFMIFHLFALENVNINDFFTICNFFNLKNDMLNDLLKIFLFFS